MVATAKPKSEKKAPAPSEGSELVVRRIPLKEIVANSAQSRGTGAIPTAAEMGYGLFEKIDIESDKEPLWPALVGNDREKAKAAADKIAELEPEIEAKASSLARLGQLQPVGVVKEGDGYNVVYGMLRCLALAYNFARGLTKVDTVEAKVLPQGTADVDLEFMSHAENNDRKQENPIDKALRYKRWKAERKMKESEIAERIDQSTQNVKNYLSLLDKLITDAERQRIAAGELSVDAALKTLKKRRDGDSGESARDGSPRGAERLRFPSIKTVEKVYEGERPKGFEDDKRWALWTSEPVRAFLAAEFGFKKKAFKEKKAPAANAGDANGKAGKRLRVPRKLADKLLVCLGQTNAQTYTDEVAADKLTNIVNIAEPGQQVEDKGCQKLLDQLLEAYPTGLTVVVGEKK